MNIAIMRVFVMMRQFALSFQELSEKLLELENFTIKSLMTLNRCWLTSSKKTLNKRSRLLENKWVIKNRTMELEQIKKSILEIRGNKVILDLELAKMYQT